MLAKFKDTIKLGGVINIEGALTHRKNGLTFEYWKNRNKMKCYSIQCQAMHLETNNMIFCYNTGAHQ